MYEQSIIIIDDTGKEHKLRRIRVCLKKGSRSKIIFEELPQDDPLQRQPDITLAKERLGWEPTVDLEVGLAKTVEYFRGILER